MKFIPLLLASIMSTASASTVYDHQLVDIDGEKTKLSTHQGKVMLLVNVASRCGFTRQYKGLEELNQTFKDKGLVVCGFPCNQFGGQEPGTEAEIKNFCETNFNITFPITSKYDVKGDKAHPIYLWAKDTYGKSTVPKWNFHKILINKEGKIVDTFASFTTPMSNKILKKLEEIL